MMTVPGSSIELLHLEPTKCSEVLGAPHFDKQNEGGVRSTLLPLDPLNFKDIVTKVIQSNHAHK